MKHPSNPTDITDSRYRMVNNAGIFLGLKNIVDETVDAFDKTMVRTLLGFDNVEE